MKREDSQSYTLQIVSKDISANVEAILSHAVDIRASDIHIDPFDSLSLIRYRIDGILHCISRIDIAKMNEYVGRIKIMSGLRIDVHDRSQDGRFFYTYKGRRIDMRVSIAPTYYGENIVIRILTSGHTNNENFESLGLSPEHIRIITKAIQRPQGLILICGPTGSGKTTTLYTMLQQVISQEVSIITLEDPVEYAMPGIRQIQVKQERGFTFLTALKGVLRQDPDIIMIGEIRDKETAQIAIQTALTGHLILSSLHAPDAASVLPRLIDMGIDPYLISSTLTLVISQRLVRKKDGYTYKGRVGVFELMPITDALKDAIFERKTKGGIEKIAMQEGMITLYEDGMNKVKKGITTKEEITRVLYE